MTEEEGPTDKTILLSGFERAFVGGLRKFGQTVPIAVYDYGAVMDVLMDQGIASEDEASEHVEYSILGAGLGEGTPCVLFRCTLKEFIEECEEDLHPDDRKVESERDYGDEDPYAYPDPDEMTKEEKRLYEKAISDFCLNFIRYVKETDSVVYARACAYARDYSGNSVVEFTDPRKEKET